MDDNKHEHRHHPINCKTAQMEEGLVTCVLLRCECGDLTFLRLPGNWSLQDVTQAPEEPTPADFAKQVGIAL